MSEAIGASLEKERVPTGIAKGMVDLILSVIALVVLAGPMFLIGVFIRLDSRGPAIFKQTRVGLKGKPFVLYKFRTMCVDGSDQAHRSYVEALIKQEQAWDGADTYKMTDDERVTRVGRWLRLTSMDELMQLFNVIKGNMSLVGPRPALPYEVELYDEIQQRRLSAKPGITGLWQVSGRSRVGFKDMVALDLAYIKNWSIWMDLKIIARTIPALVKTKGW